MRTLRPLVCFAALILLAAANDVLMAADTLAVGMGTADVTPKLEDGKPIWLAGKESNRAARGVHDRLFARAVVLRADGVKVALVSVDSIGLSRPQIEAARARLDGFNYVLVASTHSHDSPDVIGIWGPSPGQSGVVPEYVAHVQDGIVAAVREADQAAVEARCEYATAEDEGLLGDFRLPEVYDPVMRLLRFTRADSGKLIGIVVQWNSHGVEPKGVAVVSRDMMGVVVDTLSQRHACPVIYFQGAIGGLMGTPSEKYRKAGRKMPTEAFAYVQVCGEDIAGLADRALKQAQPISLAPIKVFAKPIMIALANEGYRMARAAGVLPRPAFEWTGDKYGRGAPLPAGKIDGAQAMETEVAYLRLGELDLAAIPGELYPELVYGKFQEPADPGADFPTAPLETPVTKILPREKFMLFGLANDEVGYILPKRQWDVAAPFAYGRTSSQYGEKNSVGPDTAATLLDALADRVAESQAK